MSNLSPVLVAEDNANDVFLVRRAFKENKALNPVHAVGNGDEAIQPKSRSWGSTAGTQDSLSEPFCRIDRRLERQQPQELPLGFQLRRS